ncbi:hypothetical protein N0V90_006605 [Kalmusia sp. IMI 367209]|nr:hypothetical protein N0V90_006605 [Kalmusia sp. IMI 367209]
MPKDCQALVIGASGLIGWGVVDQLLRSYPSHGTFSKVTALVNRPLKLEDSFWPNEEEGRPELDLASGVDLLSSEEEVERMLKEKVKEVESISHYLSRNFATHVTKAALAFKEILGDAVEEVRTNVGMMRRVVRAIKRLSSAFQFIVYPGGTRGYGIYRPGGIFSAPLVESMADTLPEDYAQTVAYPHYRKMLMTESTGQSWSWCELCPDAIIGFTPNGSGYSLAGHWAVYLYAWKLVHGEGVEVPFPGTAAAYDALYTETSTRTLARVAIHASLHPSVFRERIFNVADSATPGRMRDRWPEITSWFGLKGTPPPATASVEDTKPSEFIKMHSMRLQHAGAKGVQIWNANQLDSYGYWLTFDRHLSLERLRTAGFAEESAPREGWTEAFNLFKKAGMVG